MKSGRGGSAGSKIAAWEKFLNAKIFKAADVSDGVVYAIGRLNPGFCAIAEVVLDVFQNDELSPTIQ